VEDKMANTENSKLELLPHQNEAYQAVIKKFEEKGKAAVIFPTGCGKSFVALEYILKHPDERVLFLAPRRAIANQMYEYIVRYIGGDTRSIEEIQKEYGTGNNPSESLKLAARSYIPNIECMLYQMISAYGERQSVDEILNSLKPTMIIVDEMHHLKTKSIRATAGSNVVEDNEEYEEEFSNRIERENKWGKKFKKFLEDNPQAKLLGLSATPIRHDGANVVERIFKDAVASQKSLLEAMEEGIIYPPKYVVPDFVREDELETLLEKIEQAEGARKEELKAEYDELALKSANAPGIPQLMEENISEKDGKYIIFCKDISDMKEKMANAKEWFGKIDEEPEIYGISSQDNTSAEQLQSFNNSKSSHLKLMYCVGMIDEGVHLNNVSGVILATKTESRPVYTQRVGRCISSKKNGKQAIVIDLVNNNEILSNKEEVEYGYEINDIEALQQLIDWINNKNNGKLPEYSAEKSQKEKTMARRMARINNKYIKYAQNQEMIKQLDKEEQDKIQDIIELGNTIGLFSKAIKLDFSDEEQRQEDLINQFIDGIAIKGVRKDFVRLLQERLREGTFKEVMQFCEKNGRLPKQVVGTKATLTEEQIYENNLYARWCRCDEKQLVDKYSGVPIEKVPEEYKSIVEQVRSYGYGIEEKLTTYQKVIQFCEKNERLPKQVVGTKATLTEEQIYENNLYARWCRCDEKQLVDKYSGVPIEKVPEEYKSIVEQVRSYGYGIEEKLTTYQKVIQFCEKNGRLPKQVVGTKAALTEEQLYEKNLYGSWLRSDEKKLIDKYIGTPIEKIPEKDRVIVEQARYYGIEEKLTFYQEVIRFCEKNGRVPRAVHGTKAALTEEQLYEKNLYYRWRRSDEKQLVDKYAGVPIEGVPEEDREIVEQVRSYGYGVEEKLTAYQEIMQFCEKYGRWPRMFQGTNSTCTEEQIYERNLYNRWQTSDEKQIVDKYVGIPTEKIPEEDKTIIEQVRSYGYGIKRKLIGYQALMQFCKKNGRLPKQIAGKKATLTEKQIYERNLYAKWKTSKEKQLVDKYVGIPVEEIPEEDRAIVEQVRSYGYLGNAKKSANSLGKAVGKAVTVTEIQQANEFLNTITQDKEKREEQE
jgi:superfamily II DNA or RNA helicase/ribose 5-phosphate isomerase